MIDETKEQDMHSDTGGMDESGDSSRVDVRGENPEGEAIPPELGGDRPETQDSALNESGNAADSGGEKENREDSSHDTSLPERGNADEDPGAEFDEIISDSNGESDDAEGDSGMAGGEGQLPGESDAFVIDEKIEELKHAVEAIIFASDQPVNARQISAIIADLTPRRIEQVIAILNQEYRQTGRSFEIVRLGGGYQFVTLSDYFPWIRMLFKGRRKPRLSQAALETLAIVAYRQPVTKTTIEGIRGVNIDGVMQTLLERKLITIAGREKSPGRPLLYKTTGDFLQYFGLDDLDDLPNLREIEEIFNKREVPVVNEVEPLPGDEGDSGPEEGGADNPKPEGDGQ